MKKNFKNLLFVLAMGIIVAMPFGVKAADTFDWVSSTPEKTCDNGNGTCTITNSIYVITTNSSFQGNSITLKPSAGVTIESVVGKNNYTVTDLSSDKTSFNVILNTNATAVQAGVQTTIVTVTATTSSSATDCSIDMTINNITKTTTTTTTTTTTNTKTGATLPYVILGCGAVVALSVWSVSKKKSKMHRI